MPLNEQSPSSNSQYGYFEGHWTLHSNPNIPEPKALAARTFLSPVLDYEYLEGPAVLDIGCGDGIHLSIMREIFPLGLLTGVDVSRSALKACESRVSQVHLLQSSANSLPFTDEAFDIVISYGVLGYLNSISEAVAEMLRVVKRGGLVGIWIFPVPDGPLWSFGKGLRRYFSHLPARVQIGLATCLVPFLPLLPTTSRMSLVNSSWRDCREIILVNLAPPNLHFYTQTQLVDAIRVAEIRSEKLASDLKHACGYWLERL